MPEAVIVSAARSAIGRANKGSLKDFRPDDLTATIVKAALDKVPALDPNTVDDLYLGCGLPGGESGNNMGRIVNILNGMDDVPGATLTRYCASSVQTTRMAFHAIKAGEGDVFVSAGVETVSRYAKGTSDHCPTPTNPLFDEAQARTEAAAAGRRRTGTTRGRTARSRTSTSRWARRRRTSRGCATSTARSSTSSAYASQNLAEKAIADGFWEREITPVTAARRHRRHQGRRPAGRRDLRGGLPARPGLPSRRRGHRRQLLPAQRRRRGGRDHVGHQGGRARADPARPDRLHRRQRPLPRDHGPGPGRGHQACARTRRA